MAKRKPSRKREPKPAMPPNALEQALNTRAGGKYTGRKWSFVVSTDLAYVHSCYRMRRLAMQQDRSDGPYPRDLILALLCKTYPMGIDDEVERELATGITQQPYVVKDDEIEAEEEDDDGEDWSDEDETDMKALADGLAKEREADEKRCDICDKPVVEDHVDPVSGKPRHYDCVPY